MPVRAWIGSSHPGPVAAVTALTIALAISVGMEPWRVALLGAAMLFDQLSVGFSNDWIDASRDSAVGRADKPIARGAISVAAIRFSAWICLALALALTAPLGVLALSAQALALGSAWLYNAWLKRTAFSVAPFILSFGTLPAIVTLSLAHPVLPAGWALGAGSMLGVAAHFSNVLPDLAADSATGVRGLPHRLGARVSGLVIAGALVAASALLLVGAPDVLHAVGLAAAVVVGLWCVALVVRGRVTRLLFRLIIIAAVLDVALLVASGAGLT